MNNTARQAGLFASLRSRTHEIIFEADTPAGKLFDILLIIAIVASVLVVMLDSVAGIRSRYGPWLLSAEWVFTLLFSLEYILRLLTVNKPLKYARSFFGMVDLLSVIPTYLSLILPGSQFLLTIRTLRILRVFRVLKLVPFLREANTLARAMRASSRKIFIFLYTVMIVVVIVGSLMYMVEGEENGFSSIPRSIYWAIVTVTTVGFGDITPKTNIGQALAAMLMIIGYGLIAVPTGIVTTELTREELMPEVNTQCCPGCSAEGHDNDAVHCKYCGDAL